MNTARTLSGVLSLFAASAALAGPDWVERNDAGSSVATAQAVVGVGQLHTITGGLDSGFGLPDYEDMYLIRITDPSTFRLTILGANFDATLWLFNVTQAGEGFGLLANQSRDGESLDPILGPISNDDSGASVNAPGIYAFAISGAGRTPISARGQIFSFDFGSETSGPDGPGGRLPLIGWDGIGQTGSYAIGVKHEGNGKFLQEPQGKTEDRSSTRRIAKSGADHDRLFPEHFLSQLQTEFFFGQRFRKSSRHHLQELFR